MELIFWGRDLSHKHELEFHEEFKNIRIGEWYDINNIQEIINYLTVKLNNIKYTKINLPEEIIPPEEINIIFFEDKNINDLFLNSIKNPESQVSKFIFNLFKEKYYYNSIDNNWYVLENNIWKIKLNINLVIMDDISKYYCDFLETLENNLQTNKKIIKKLDKIISYLSDTKKLEKIIEQLYLRYSEIDNPINLSKIKQPINIKSSEDTYLTFLHACTEDSDNHIFSSVFFRQYYIVYLKYGTKKTILRKK